jgi:hypothetical protein
LEDTMTSPTKEKEATQAKPSKQESRQVPLSEGRQALLAAYRKTVAEGRHPWRDSRKQPASPKKPGQ